MIILPAITVDLDDNCDGVQFAIDFKNTLSRLQGLTITGSEMSITDGANCVAQTKPWTPCVFSDGAQGATFRLRGIAAGDATGLFKLRLSDNEHVVEGWSLRIKNP